MIADAAFAQPNWLTKYFDDARAGKNPNTPAEVFKIDNIKTAVELLPNYLNDSSTLVRNYAIRLTRIIGTQSQWRPTRLQATRWLVQATRDRDGGNVATALESLTTFTKQDFLKGHRDSIASLLKPNTVHQSDAIKLMGFLEMNEVTDQLLSISSNVSENKSNRWAALLALARMGNSTAISSINSRVRKLVVNDDVVMEVFPDLIYTRQPELFNYVIEVLQSDERLCESADNDNPIAIPCGYRVMEQLAVAIKDYPLVLDASGDIKTSDYKKALTTVREWFKVKGNNYEVERGKY
jgi:hypothetical protein